MISFVKVSKFILSDMSIHIQKGLLTGLIGASGSGKTTFMKLACGLLEPAQGHVYTLRSEPVTNRQKLGRDLGAFFTEIPALQSEETVIGNYENLKIIHRMQEGEFQKEYEGLSKRLGFHLFAQEKVKNLSLGQRKRAELGAVLLHRPRVLLFDEPTNGLDENAKAVFREIIKERAREGAAIVITSHDMEEISQMCSRIALLEQGQLLFYGDRESIGKQFAPSDVMELKLCGKLPDLEDLPVEKYLLKENRLTLIYNPNHITAAEILRLILSQTVVEEAAIQKPELKDIITKGVSQLPVSGK